MSYGINTITELASNFTQQELLDWARSQYPSAQLTLLHGDVIQTTTAAAVALGQYSGETINQPAADVANIYVRSEVDLEALRGATINIECVDTLGVKHTATATLNATNSTEEVEVTDLAGDFRWRRKFKSSVKAVTDNNIQLCNSDGTVIYDVIHDGFAMSNQGFYHSLASHKAWLYRLEGTFTHATALAQILVNYIPIGETLTSVKSIDVAKTNPDPENFIPLELKANSLLNLQVIDDGTNHDAMNVKYWVLEIDEADL